MSNVKAYLEDIVRDGLHDIAEALKGGGPAGDVQASHVSYDNETSGLLGANAQEAIDELSTKVNTNASGISDLGDDVSVLTSRMGTAEGDITALDGRLDTAEGNITSLDGRLDTAEEDITALETWKDNLDASDIPYGSGTVADALDYKAGDSISIESVDYLYGLVNNNQVIANIPINKPIKASSATISNFPSSAGFSTVGGIKNISNIVLSSVTIGINTIQIVLSSSGFESIARGTPIVFGATFTINFS